MLWPYHIIYLTIFLIATFRVIYVSCPICAAEVKLISTQGCKEHFQQLHIAALQSTRIKILLEINLDVVESTGLSSSN